MSMYKGQILLKNRDEWVTCQVFLTMGEARLWRKFYEERDIIPMDEIRIVKVPRY